jgi:hypothetical protein
MKVYFLYVAILISLYACKNNADKEKNQNTKDSAITINQPTTVIAKTDTTSIGDTLIIKEYIYKYKNLFYNNHIKQVFLHYMLS